MLGGRPNTAPPSQSIEQAPSDYPWELMHTPSSCTRCMTDAKAKKMLSNFSRHAGSIDATA